MLHDLAQTTAHERSPDTHGGVYARHCHSRVGKGSARAIIQFLLMTTLGKLSIFQRMTGF